MPIGKGKYGDLCTHVRETAKADGAIIIVIRGEHGSGFSVQADVFNVLSLPESLRSIAQEIEDSFEKGQA